MEFDVQLNETQNISVQFNENGGFNADLGIGSAVVVGIDDHTKLRNRDAEDQHPISAITKLKATLDSRPSEALTNSDIEDLLNKFV